MRFGIIFCLQKSLLYNRFTCKSQLQYISLAPTILTSCKIIEQRRNLIKFCFKSYLIIADLAFSKLYKNFPLNLFLRSYNVILIDILLVNINSYFGVVN